MTDSWDYLSQGGASLTLGWFMKPLRGKEMQRPGGTKTGSIQPRHIWSIFTTPARSYVY
jgi:hypothetical protein